MSRSHRLLWFAAAVLIGAGLSTAASATPTIGGEPVAHLTRQQTGNTPQFLGVTLFPGRGLNVFQITAYIPGKGAIHVLASPSVATAAHLLTGSGPDTNGDLSYTFGGAFLIPYPNRIFSTVSTDNRTITTEWHGHKMVLPANAGHAIKTAMHGLILESKIQDVKIRPTPDGETLTGTLHAGNFGGHWLSSTDLHFTVSLTGPAINVSIKATNVGKTAEPMSIGWHPYFAIPSGQRAQTRLYVPAIRRALITSYQVEQPTGKFQLMAGTPYAFHVPGGAPLDHTYLDDSFSQLIRSHGGPNGGVDVKIIDPASHYGIEEIGLSPAIQAVQVYSPPNAKFVAIEQQYNLVDPFGKEWHGINTGMVDLQPGHSTTWHVQLHLFTPNK